MSNLKKIKEPKRARIGFYSAGLCTYWEQFEGLYNCLTGYNRFIEKKLSQWGEVYNFGMVDTEEKGRAAGEFFNKNNVDIVFLMQLPIIQVPVSCRYIRLIRHR